MCNGFKCCCFDHNQAVDTTVRILKEGQMDAIKLEGGSPSRIVAAKAIVEAGIAVIGHVGLTPQAISVLGGFRPQGRNVASAVKVYISILSCMMQVFLHLNNVLVILKGMSLCRLSRQHWLCKKQGVLLLFLNVCLHRWLQQQQRRFKFLQLELGLVPIAVDRSVGLIFMYVWIDSKLVIIMMCYRDFGKNHTL